MVWTFRYGVLEHDTTCFYVVYVNMDLGREKGFFVVAVLDRNKPHVHGWD